MKLLQSRSGEQEWMDDLNCHGAVVDQTLRELETINRLLGGDHVTINGIDKLLSGRDKKKGYRIADLGCGGGDMAVKINRWSRRNSFSLAVTGVDANPHIIDFARKNSARDEGISFEVCNVFDAEFRKLKFDIVTATLFIHHFTEEQLVDLFKSLRTQSRLGIVINDIHRHYLAYHSIRILTRFFSKSEMVKFDAPLSVRRAFRKDELERILELAGINNYTLKWKWAFRWQIVITC